MFREKTSFIKISLFICIYNYKILNKKIFYLFGITYRSVIENNIHYFRKKIIFFNYYDTVYYFVNYKICK